MIYPTVYNFLLVSQKPAIDSGPRQVFIFKGI